MGWLLTLMHGHLGEGFYTCSFYGCGEALPTEESAYFLCPQGTSCYISSSHKEIWKTASEGRAFQSTEMKTYM